MKKTNFQGNSKKPDIEVNKPPEQKFWQKQGPFSVCYFVLMMILFYIFQFAIQIKKEQIPYSRFQEYFATDQVAECVIRAVVQESYQRVRSLLEESRPVLDSLAAKLEKKETLSGEEVKSIIGNPQT